MGALRRIHRWLDALSERTKIIGLLAAIAVGLALVGGVAVFGAGDGESAAVRDAYENGLGLAQSLDDGLSSGGEITGACVGVLSAARASSQGIEATYTSEQAAAFYRGCEDGAPEAESQLGATSETTTPTSPVQQAQAQLSGVTTADGAAIPANLAAAFSQGRVLGEQLAAMSQSDPAMFEQLAEHYVDASLQIGQLALPSGDLYNIPLQFDPTDKIQVDAFYAGVLDAAAVYFHQLAAKPEPEHQPNDTMGYTGDGHRIPYVYFEDYNEGRGVGTRLAKKITDFSEYERLVKKYMMANVEWSDSSIMFYFVQGAQDAWNDRQPEANLAPSTDADGAAQPDPSSTGSEGGNGAPLP